MIINKKYNVDVLTRCRTDVEAIEKNARVAHSHLLRVLLLFLLPHIRLYHTMVPCNCSCDVCGDMTGGDAVD